jgi:hypothetical protein
MSDRLWTPAGKRVGDAEVWRVDWGKLAHVFGLVDSRHVAEAWVLHDLKCQKLYMLRMIKSISCEDFGNDLGLRR